MGKKIIITLLLMAILMAVSFYYDEQIIQVLYSFHNYYFTEFFLGVAFISSEIIILFFLTSLFLWQERKRKWIIPLWITLGFSAGINYLLKNSIQRIRPFESGIVPLASCLQNSITGFSFPSGHAIVAFSALPILSREFPKLKYWWLAFAVIIAISRVYLGVHFLSDVIAGAILGYCIGEFIIAVKMRRIF